MFDRLNNYYIQVEVSVQIAGSQSDRFDCCTVLKGSFDADHPLDRKFEICHQFPSLVTPEEFLPVPMA
jgi:hypothetical protein